MPVLAAAEGIHLHSLAVLLALGSVPFYANCGSRDPYRDAAA